jgi:hypothetical protein
MANISSVEYAIASAPPVSAPLDPTQDKGRIRIAHFDFTGISPGSTDVLFHARMPAGKVRLLRYCAQKTAFATNATMNLGHNGYTNRATGAAVAASAAAFLAAFAMDNTNDEDQLIDVAIDSRGGFDVRGTMAAAGGTSENLIGWIEYVVD